MSGMTVRRASRPGAARLAAVAVSALLAACSGADAASTDDAPEGFARYTADTYTFVYPEAWEIQAADDQVVDGRDVEIVGPVVTGGYAPGIGVASGDSLPADTSMGQRVAVFNLAADAEIAGREVLDEEAVDVPGAVGARRIEARYDSPGLGGEDVELRQLDVLAVREDGLQVDLRVGGPAADLDDAQVRTVLESLELRG